MCIWFRFSLRHVYVYITLSVPTACLPTPSTGHSCPGWDWPKCHCASWLKTRFTFFLHYIGLVHESGQYIEIQHLFFCPEPTLWLCTPSSYSNVSIMCLCIQLDHRCRLQSHSFIMPEREQTVTHVPPLKLCHDGRNLLILSYLHLQIHVHLQYKEGGLLQSQGQWKVKRWVFTWAL